MITNKIILHAARDPKNEVSQMIFKLVDELENLKQELDSFKITAYAKFNERGDLYDLRLQNNPYDDQNFVLPLYAKIKK